ncbi:MAG: dihydrofolate reductase [Bacteroidales bacterium]|nr:dihydrofolate reductase [Bacteroidales bacterium]
MKTISIIVAVARNNAIGKDNRLLCHLSDDLKRFKQITLGKTVVMGRNTFLSLPVRPLPGRRNIVITDVPGEMLEGCVIAGSIREAMDRMDDGENFIIGGGSIYRQFMPFAHRLMITRIHEDFEADTFFPDIDPVEWEVESVEDHLHTDDKNPVPYSYVIYRRRKQQDL